MTLYIPLCFFSSLSTSVDIIIQDAINRRRMGEPEGHNSRIVHSVNPHRGDENYGRQAWIPCNVSSASLGLYMLMKEISKSQYETKFAKWNWRKNLNSSDWRFVLEKKRKRAALGKESNVTLNGNLIPHKRIQKEEQRLTISQLSRDPISCKFGSKPFTWM